MSLYKLIEKFYREVPTGLIMTMVLRSPKEMFSARVYHIKNSPETFEKFKVWMGSTNESAQRLLDILQRCADEEK